MAYFIHPTTIVDEPCTIGTGTKVWHFCHIMSKSVIGEHCTLGQNVFVGANVRIGSNVKIENNVSLYDGMECEDDVFIGPSVVFTNVLNPRAFIDRKDEFKSTVVQQGATIGANATIVCGVTIGMYAMVGAGSVVVDDVPAYALMVGNPARQIGWVSKEGERVLKDEEK